MNSTQIYRGQNMGEGKGGGLTTRSIETEIKFAAGNMKTWLALIKLWKRQ